MKAFIKDPHGAESCALSTFEAAQRYLKKLTLEQLSIEENEFY
jgi:hypothetical protein